MPLVKRQPPNHTHVIYPQRCAQVGTSLDDRCSVCATFGYMDTVASRELRNQTAGLLRRVADGDSVIITVNGSPAAVLSPVPGLRRPFLTKAQSIELLTQHQTDAGLSAELRELAGETTDDLGVIR